MDIKNICYYKIRTENGTVNTARYLELFQRLMDP